MPHPILEIDNVSKKYRIRHEGGGYLSLRERLLNVMKTRKTVMEDFRALDDISFNVDAGESLGIIGRNGAGKSTLLKVLSRITRPTNGKITTRGRIASLLEVGTGFHPELTGLENIFFNGSLLGMRKKEIRDKFDDIVDFSGVSQFLDTPLKHYSSGMQLRLAFAVAAFLEPEILVIDEVLAVGDAEFQQKCLGKMENVTKSGRTILFVSHNMSAVRSLCSRAMILEKGRIAFMGSPDEAIDHYLSSSRHHDDQSNGIFDLTRHSGKKDRSRGIRTARLLRNGTPSGIFFPGEEMKVEFEFENDIPIVDLTFGFVIRDSSHQALVGINNWDLSVRLNSAPVKSGKLVLEIDKIPFYGNGTYSMDLYFGDSWNNFDTIEHALTFRLEANDVFGNGKTLDTRINSVYPGRVRISCA
jgi:lipopolysaccharide transport system ATP-binding protein